MEEREKASTVLYSTPRNSKFRCPVIVSNILERVSQAEQMNAGQREKNIGEER